MLLITSFIFLSSMAHILISWCLHHIWRPANLMVLFPHPASLNLSMVLCGNQMTTTNLLLDHFVVTSTQSIYGIFSCRLVSPFLCMCNFFSTSKKLLIKVKSQPWKEHYLLHTKKRYNRERTVSSESAVRTNPWVIRHSEIGHCFK